MIKLESNLKKYSLLIPTSIKEFTPEILNSMTSNINLAPNYAIVAIIYKPSYLNLVLQLIRNILQK